MIQRVLAPNPGLMTGTGTNTYLVAGGRGEVAVVDAGPDDPRHLAAIVAAAQPMGRIAALLVTHGHADHLPGAVALREQTGAPIVGHARLREVDRVLADAAQLEDVHGLKLVGLETPGHTDDSLCFWDPAERALLTGDLIAGSGTLVVDEARGGLARYLGSLERLCQLGPCTIYPGHGPVAADGQGKIAEYLAHRAQREQQILDALSGGPVTVDSIVGLIYQGVAPGLVAMAARNVRAHLRKLEDEGSVVETGGAWRLTAATDS